MTEYVSIESLLSRAESSQQRGQWAQAEEAYRVLLLQSHVTDYEYDDWARKLIRVYEATGAAQPAAYIHAYLDGSKALKMSAKRLQAEMLTQQGRHAEAAECYLEDGMVAHAAIAQAKGKNHEDASELFLRLFGSEKMRGFAYEMALTYFNYGTETTRAGGDKARSHEALVQSQQILESLAADFEQKGLRDRAFDCYQVLLELGRNTEQFENLAEGYIGCIRVLKEDNLKFYALQYYEDFIAQAVARKEYNAAATLLSEAGQYCRRSGLPYGRGYWSKAGDAWARCAQKHLEDGLPVSLAENALLASVACYSRIGDFASVKLLFESLATLEVSEANKNRYRTASARYNNIPPTNQSSPELPSYLKKQNVYAEIWYADLLSWEKGSDIEWLAMSIVSDLKYHNSIRRRALSILLLHDADKRKGSTEINLQLIRLVGELQSYGALFPLEAMYESGNDQVKASCVSALKFLYFKRSFVILRNALSSNTADIRKSAVEVLKGRVFPHALNPLRQIVDSYDAREISDAAIEAIGKIQTVEAGEYLIELVRNERGTMQTAALSALAMIDNPDIAPILKQNIAVEQDDTTRRKLEKIISNLR